MNCREIEEVLPEFVDGGLEPGPAAAVREHLAGCAGCAALQEDLRAALALVQTDVVPEPPAGTWDRFGAEVWGKIRLAEEVSPMARAAEAAAPQPPPRSGLPWPTFGERLSTWLSWARVAPGYAVGTAAAVLLAIGVGLYQYQRGPSVPDRQLALVQDLEVVRGVERPEDLEVLRGVDRPDDLEMIERLPALLALVRES